VLGNNLSILHVLTRNLRGRTKKHRIFDPAGATRGTHAHGCRTCTAQLENNRNHLRQWHLLTDPRSVSRDEPKLFNVSWSLRSIAQSVRSVQWLAQGWTVEVSEIESTGRGKIFLPSTLSRPVFWDHTASYTMDTGGPSFPGGEAAGVWSSPLTSIQCQDQEYMDLYIHSHIRQLINRWINFTSFIGVMSSTHLGNFRNKV
jgi:hypothetical protein